MKMERTMKMIENDKTSEQVEWLTQTVMTKTSGKITD